jgi:hypothetical protein
MGARHFRKAAVFPSTNDEPRFERPARDYKLIGHRILALILDPGGFKDKSSKSKILMERGV